MSDKEQPQQNKQPTEAQMIEAMLGTIENQFKMMSAAILTRSM